MKINKCAVQKYYENLKSQKYTYKKRNTVVLQIVTIMGDYGNDRAFEAVLQNTGQNIELFIDEFFSFLARRSDFFVVTPPEGDRIGFPPGVAAKLIISKFKKWEEYVNKKKVSLKTAGVAVPEVGVEVEVPHKEIDKNISTSVPQKPEASNDIMGKGSTFSSVEKSRVASEPVQSKDKAIGLWDAYNGRKTDKYSWSQSIKELDVHIAVSKDIKTKKQVKVEIQMKKIRVVTGIGSENEVVTDWQLSYPIVKDDSYWSLHPGESIFLSLQKVREMWWDHLFEGEECIDRSKIEAVRPMEDLEEDEQAKIQELVWNQEQKLKGLPTSEELKMKEVMEKAWNAEGSPFKGQPFDMSRIQLTSNTISPLDQESPPCK